MATIQTDKFTALLHSRKFWSLVTAEVGLGVATYFHGLPLDQAIPLAVGALATYMIGTALEDAGQAPSTSVTVHAPTPTPIVTMTSGGVNATATPGVIVTSPPRD